jgi:hypothetical protein
MNTEAENLNEPQNPQLNIGAVIGSAYSDSDLQDRVNHWLDHYTRYGESHYADTKDWRILEIYWDKILDRVLNQLEIEEHEVEPMADRISALF